MVLDPRPGQRVLDLCAAPGSKTSQIAMHMNNQGLLKANEPVRQRLYRLKSVLQLTGAKAQISSTDGRRLKEHEGLYDRILVDAPCSCEGRFIIDEPKSFAYWSVRKIKEMSHKQKGLLLNASRLLDPAVSWFMPPAPLLRKKMKRWWIGFCARQMAVLNLLRYRSKGSKPILV